MFKALKILFLLILLAMLIFVSCGYTPPENLTKLIEMEGYTLYCPLWSPGGKIYFLVAKCLFDEIHLYEGSLWVCDTNGANLRLILTGKFGCFDVSPDGGQIALTCGRLYNEIGEPEGGPLIIIDSTGLLIDTFPTSQQYIVVARFSRDGEKIYYSAYSETLRGYFRANIDGTNEEFLMWDDYPDFFEITDGGRLIHHLGVCDLSPTDTNKVIWTNPPSDKYASHELRMRNLLTDIDSSLDVRAYRDVGVCFPYWSPSGRKIVFSVAEDDAGWETHHYGYGELWILDLTK